MSTLRSSRPFLASKAKWNQALVKNQGAHMFDELMLYNISTGVVFNDVEAMKKLITDLGESTPIPLSLHSTRTGLSFPLKHAMYQIAISHARSDTALNKLVKDIGVPIEIPGDINALDLPDGFHRKLGLPCNDKTFKRWGEVKLDRTLAAMNRVEVELKFRRNSLIKHIREHGSPETFCAAVCLGNPEITLDDVLKGVKDGDDRFDLRDRLMSRAPWVIRKLKHLGYSKVSELVFRMQLLEPRNPQRFEFWAAMFEQLHPGEGISPVADAFLHYLLHEGPSIDEQGCRDILRGLIWGVSTDNRAIAMAVFLDRLDKSPLRDIQDELLFQATFAVSGKNAIQSNIGNKLPDRALAWLSMVQVESQLLPKLLKACLDLPSGRHNDQAWTVIQCLLDEELIQKVECSHELVLAYEEKLITDSSMTLDYLPRAGKFIRWNRHDISDHVGSIRYLAGF